MGDRGNESLSEQSERGTGFLADLCTQWEEAARSIDNHVRLVNMRIGVVMSPRGGALQKMLLPFQMGGGGPIGSGQQFFSWIDIDDLCCAIYHAIVHEELSGPVNLVSPNAVTNAEFAQTLGRVLGAPHLCLCLLSLQDPYLVTWPINVFSPARRCVQTKLLESGYQFRNPDLESSLRKQLGRQVR